MVVGAAIFSVNVERWQWNGRRGGGAAAANEIYSFTPGYHTNNSDESGSRFGPVPDVVRQFPEFDTPEYPSWYTTLARARTALEAADAWVGQRTVKVAIVDMRLLLPEQAVPVVLPFAKVPPPGATYPEWAATQVVVNRYERDPKARAACNAHYKPICTACHLNFATVYDPGVLGPTGE